MSKLSPVPYKVQMTGPDRRVSRNWAQFFESWLRRSGGVGDVATNQELEAQSELELGAQTASWVALLQQQIDALFVSLPEKREFAVPDNWAELTPRQEGVIIETLGLAPRGESVAPDFILGEIT